MLYAPTRATQCTHAIVVVASWTGPTLRASIVSKARRGLRTRTAPLTRWQGRTTHQRRDGQGERATFGRPALQSRPTTWWHSSHRHPSPAAHPPHLPRVGRSTDAVWIHACVSNCCERPWCARPHVSGTARSHEWNGPVNVDPWVALLLT